jgi:hypothetical protein
MKASRPSCPSLPTASRLRTLRTLGTCAWVLALFSCSDDPPTPPAPTVEPLVTQAFDGTQTCEITRDGVVEPELTARKVRVVLNRPITSTVTEPDLLKSASLTAGLVSDALATDAEIDVDLSLPDGAPGREIAFETAANNATASYGEKGHWVIATDAEGHPTLQGDSDAWLIVKDPTSKDGWTASCRWDLVPAEGPAGPIGYDALKTHFAGADQAVPKGTVEQSLESGCGGGFEKTASGLKIASLALHFVPGVGTALGVAAHGGAVVAEVIGSSKSEACMESTLDNINEALATQAERIDGIVEDMALAQDAFYAEAYTSRLNDSQQWAYLWKHNGLDILSPTSTDQGGIFGNFMVLAGLWSNLQGPAVPGVDVKTIAGNTALFEDLRGYVQSQTQSFQGAVTEISGTTVAGSCVVDCYKSVQAKPTAALINLNQSVFETLKARMNVLLPFGHPTNTFETTNVVPTYESYNNTLTTFFQRALVSLQQAYTLESLVNQLNYYRGAAATTPSGVTQINALNAIGETHYDYTRLVVNGIAPDEATQVKAFNQAQKKLAYLYAARMNQLYLNTINYIVSDVPVGQQKYPTADVVWTFDGQLHTHAAPAYATEVGKALKPGYDRNTSTDQGPTPMSFLPKVTDGAWQSRAVLYQYAGLRDVAKCIKAVQAYNQSPNQVGTLEDALAQPDACPALLTAGDGSTLDKGYYDGDTMQPYVEVDGKMQLAGLMTDNLKFCDETAPALGWLAPTGAFVGNDAGLEAGKTYLSCGHWYLPKKDDGSIKCAALPRAHCPANNEAGAEDFYQKENAPTGYTCSPVGETSTSIYGGSLGDKQKLNGNTYVYWTGLFGNWPLDMRSCAAIVSSSSPFSASYSNSRAEPEYSGSLGCQLAYFGHNPIPYFQWTLEENALGQFGIRLPNPTNVGGAGAFSGFVLPVKIVGGAGGSGGSSYGVQAFLKVTRSGTMERDGFHCRNTGTVTGADNRNPIRCTLKDGTQYDLKLTGSTGSDGHFRSYLDLKLVDLKTVTP